MHKTVAEKSVLTQKELAVLSFLVQGKTKINTAHVLGISERMVYRRLANIRKKTNTTSTEELIYIVTKQGLI